MAFRPRNVRISIVRRFFLSSFLCISSAALALPGGGGSSPSAPSGPMRWSGIKTFYDRSLNKVELVGEAEVHQNEESLFADKIVVEVNTRVVHATGHARYSAKDSDIEAEEMHLNLETRTGTIVRGRVITPQFTLSGDQIHKLSKVKFQTEKSEFTTCKDCPRSWSFLADNVDLEIQGYAYLSNVRVKIVDTPTFWIPYMVVPIKTQRQTGFLIPNFGFTNLGGTFVQPFFWAISRSTDMTFGAGQYGGQGRRLEWEGRYALRSGEGTVKFFHIQDKLFRNYLLTRSSALDRGISAQRYSLQVFQKQKLFWGIEEKLRIQEVSDNLYHVRVLGDLPQAQGEAFLGSTFSLSKSNNDWSGYVAARRWRNFLGLNTPDVTTSDPRVFDSNTVQLMPQARFAMNDVQLGDGLFAGGVGFGFSRFWRSGKAYDVEDNLFPSSDPLTFRPGIDPLREATRFELEPHIYSTYRLFDSVQVSPSLQYRHYWYDFGTTTRSLSRGYPLLQLSLGTQLERVFFDSETGQSSTKHLIRPHLIYSYIPFVQEDRNHPFVKQMQFANDYQFSGFNFDNRDIFPLDGTFTNSNYFDPQGNALAYGFTSQLIRKNRVQPVIEKPASPATSGGLFSGLSKPDSSNNAGGQPTAGSDVSLPSYTTALDWKNGQSFNFRELRKNDGSARPLSRYYSLLSANWDHLSAHADYYYTPYIPITDATSRHSYSTGMSYYTERSIHQTVLYFERSVSLNYVFNRLSTQSQTQVMQGSLVYSLSDYIMPSMVMTYDLIRQRVQEVVSALVFQSPSQCWKLDLGYRQTICEKVRPEDSGRCGAFRVNLSLNLTGSGFTGTQPQQ